MVEQHGQQRDFLVRIGIYMSDSGVGIVQGALRINRAWMEGALSHVVVVVARQKTVGHHLLTRCGVAGKPVYRLAPPSNW